MENFSKEIIQTIVDDYSDDMELVVSMLSYLYQTTLDDNMKKSIIDVFNVSNRCIECGDKMTPYEWTDDNGDTHTTYDCLRCSDREDR